ncbi:MAG: 2-hydroxyacyl-CoA dehydratase family protein, partial [Oscillospiraceae bacterium]|nr:2-hydroxyacyl-CoA dehydratase family protein [Oscillospiraceae bacterium]
IFSSPCDTLKCMAQKWKGTCPSIQFTHPQNRHLESANVFLTHEYEIVRKKLEEIIGEKITDEAISRSIDVYNENRAAMREFVETAAKYPQIINAKKRHAVIKSRFFMEKSKHTQKVRELIRELKALPVEPWKGKKVILTGILAEPDELLDIFDQFGLAVVADDLAQEARQFRTDVPEEGGEPLFRMAKQYQNIYGCALACDFKHLNKGQMLMDMAKDTGADAIIVCMMKFCDPEEYDFGIYNTQLDDAGVRYLYLEIDQEAVSFEQARTRVQSFVEML